MTHRQATSTLADLQLVNSQLTGKLKTCNQVSIFPFGLTSAYVDIPKTKLMQYVEQNHAIKTTDYDAK